MTFTREDCARLVGMQSDGILAGLWPQHAWPGGYVIGYYADDGEVLCADCMDDPTNPVHFMGDADGWRIDGAGVIYEAETDVRCAHCNVLIMEGDET
ncbi:hypothetical protein K0U83_08250 [bacterium]|jgi:hypothetical protein|nr:hypothetical protein [bacterium]